ncbi:MAG: hypothetical protein DRJ33_01345 [Candidatus Methanomethylicota archaeon]|uniref:Uncharacterized protein n=1 Tax=Thermoproteota archaeon TaxID=2056631 RepID=A0A497F105_9CREN|nr:MAG: hypothetical protein DRJ33_01345 [Candidatus Verstraetearchaeota archaeon]
MYFSIHVNKAIKAGLENDRESASKSNECKKLCLIELKNDFYTSSMDQRFQAKHQVKHKPIALFTS